MVYIQFNLQAPLLNPTLRHASDTGFGPDRFTHFSFHNGWPSYRGFKGGRFSPKNKLFFVS
ncbi:hypothetical protein Hanom_Chr07g00620721 [Helianthus anomalus]